LALRKKKKKHLGLLTKGQRGGREEGSKGKKREITTILRTRKKKGGERSWYRSAKGRPRGGERRGKNEMKKIKKEKGGRGGKDFSLETYITPARGRGKSGDLNQVSKKEKKKKGGEKSECCRLLPIGEARGKKKKERGKGVITGGFFQGGKERVSGIASGERT